MTDTVEDILHKEAQFADMQYKPHENNLDISPRMFRKYSDPQHPWDWRECAGSLLGQVRGKVILDYGCGMGEEAAYLARMGATVHAIDISPVGVAVTRRRAEHNGLSDSIHAEVMKCNPTSFPDDTFDMVHGLGILHHVGLEESLPEIKRVLKPGGTAVFMEPLGNYIWIERTKKWISRKNSQKFTQVTDDERNLTYGELMAFRSQYSSLNLYPFHLLTRVRKFFPRALHDPFRILDFHMLRNAPVLRGLAGAVVIHLRK
jgi:2-polyprenyl-3-methyl-5-hydroxy-6-metoxy-1,4-benzoquinol methylase